MTRVRDSALTDGWSFRTRETVATETPAAAATSLMLAIAVPPPCGIVYTDVSRGIGIDYTQRAQEVVTGL
ncbi:hypothetical protein GCM10010512_51970 [Streptomyces thermoviolaceus subsp. thermoviolaceus]|nr:hypothetical protein GCM10010499_26690 [Streptomyces thermoviolaceus subsp. apingens]GHB14350.1 hypothetical protein GCM10010512_51970 [Streptomyces thermoviolaceus subsp. thermoviolaceus]